MNRRELIKGAGITTAVVALGGLESACKPKDLTFWDETIIGALEEVAVLVPAQVPSIKKIVAVVRDFDAAYKANQFSNALALFTNLTSLIDTLITDLGIGISPVIKTALALANIGIRAVALLLKQQGESLPAIKATKSPAINNVRRLANEQVIDAIYRAAKP